MSGDQPITFYRLLYASMYYEAARWQTYTTHDSQREAYEAMSEYRDGNAEEKGLLPMRIVRVVGKNRYDLKGDETFIDETGCGLVEWQRMVLSGEWDALFNEGGEDDPDEDDYRA